MDVRCEKCHTEYELEESKVTEAGVTVKCTSCGNLFKIKRKTAQPPPRPPDLPATDSGGMWLIRSPGGENRRFRELTTLQQWIVERKVTRDTEISRTGETWKKLGDITELVSFFAIVDQAQSVARPGAAAERRSTQPFAPQTVSPARPPSIPTLPVSSPSSLGSPLSIPAAEPFDLEEAPSEPSIGSTPLVAAAFEKTQPAMRAGNNGDERPRPAPTAVVRKPAPVRESWAGTAASPPGDVGEGGEDPSWAQSPAQVRTERVSPSPFGGDEFSDLDMLRRRRGRSGWVWVVAVIVLGGGAAGWFLLRPGGEPAAAAGAADAGPKATPVVSAALDGGAGAGADVQKKIQDALAKLGEDTDEGYAAAAKLLEDAHVADDALDARVRATQALVETTAAQALADDASAAEAGKADPAQLRAEAERRLTRGAKLAREAAAKAPADPDVAVALGDVLRLEKKPAADVEKALAPAGDKPEALYVKGLLRARDGKAAEARDLLEKAIAAKAKEGAELLRARFHLAVIEADDKKVDDAKKELDAILATQPAHARAKALKARLEAPPAPVAKPIEPPREKPTPEKPEKPEKPGKPAAVATDDLSGPVTSKDYDGLVARGNKQAENGDCNGAMRSFERALDARPGGVEALTGIGYCYLDRKQYGQALSNFRAALGISSRYSEALIGMAEAYRYQGQSKEAVAYYRRYLEQSPNGPKAGMARRHVEELGGSDEAPKPDQPVTAPPPPPTPPPSAPSLDKLPDKPGASTTPEAPPSAPPIDKLPDKPERAGQMPPPPPAAGAPEKGEPTAPDSPH